MEYDIDRIQVKTIHAAIDFSQKQVLEIGCGDGKTSLHLARGTQTYTAIDPDQGLINLAKDLTHKNQVHPVLFKVGSGQALEFEAAVFDIVLFTLSLHHQDSQTALKEAFRVLKPDGRLLVIEPLANGEFQQFFHLFNDETPVLEAAIAAIQTSRFRQVKREVFHVIARFENTQDLLSYDFDRDKAMPGDDKKILDLLDRLKEESLQDLAKASNSQFNRTIRFKDELQMLLLKK